MPLLVAVAIVEPLLASLDDTARLIAIDRDPDAVAQGLQLAACDARFQIVRGRFSQMAEIVTQVGATAVQGILMDLGVSSPQLDHARRGFSFRFFSTARYADGIRMKAPLPRNGSILRMSKISHVF